MKFNKFRREMRAILLFYIDLSSYFQVRNVSLLDTHIWIWWVQDIDRLSNRQIEILSSNERTGLGVSIISCWEIAKLVEKNRLDLSLPTKEWFDTAINYPGIKLLELTPAIALESTQLPGQFHKDPADQIIVATSRIYHIDLLTADKKIIKYKHVSTLNQ